MSRISIDLNPDPNKPEMFLPSEELSAISLGCLRGLKGLGELAKTVEAIRVTFIKVAHRGAFVWGPRFEIHFADTLGEKCSHTTDFRFMGQGTPTPNSTEISDHLVSGDRLPRHIREHLEKCKTRIAKATKDLEQLTKV